MGRLLFQRRGGNVAGRTTGLSNSGPPDWPPAARLTKGEGNAMDRYPSADSMITMFRSGKRADGSVVKVMPDTLSLVGPRITGGKFST